MRILLHDFSGHPFQAELARSLGARGHDVLHVQCDSYNSGKGFLADDSGHARFESVSLGRPFEKYKTKQRLKDELSYGRRFVRVAREFRPDLIISCNDPLIAKAVFGAWAAARRVRWIFWLQDVYSVAMAAEAERRSRAGRAVGRVLKWVERRLLRSADAVVPVTEDYGPILDSWRVPDRKRTIIENWAPIREFPLKPRLNDWRSELGLGEDFVYLYAGTLGLKHDPDLLVDLAVAEPSSVVVVVSEGLGADHLNRAVEERGLQNLRVLPFQPWTSMPEVLGAADVLVVLLRADAGVFSVPSKVLTDLCAGRPILASIPATNLGGRTVEAAGAGVVVTPGDAEEFLQAAKRLRTDSDSRRSMGSSGRAYAEKAFDIARITDQFEQVITSAGRRRRKDAATP